MEYTTVWQPVTIIFISFSMGAFFGALWMFYSMYKSNKKIEEELDSKTRLLDTYEQQWNYEDDGYQDY